MGFLRKLFSGDDQAKQAPVVEADKPLLNEQPGFSNDAALQQTGLADKEEDKDGGWLSRAWQGIKDAGKAMKNGAKGGAATGALVGAIPGGAVGAAVGGGLGAAGGKDSAMKGAAVGGGVLALPGALVGGLLGGIGGAFKGLADHMDSDDEQFLKETADIPGYHVLLEQFAHIYAYGKGDMNTLDMWGYELSSEFEDKNSGFRVIALSPTSKDAKDPDGNPLKPVVAFRGTANGGGALDDINDQGIGTFQFSRNEKEIKNVIATAKGPSLPDVTGHSLGGALAQLCAARLGSMVGDIVTFQSAGITGDDAQRIDKDAHQATHYRTEGDIVHSSGEAVALGKVIEFEQKGTDSALSHMTFPLAQLNALRGKGDSDVPAVEGVRDGSYDEWVIDKEGDYHNGHWKDQESQGESLLHRVDRYDSDEEVHSGLVTAAGGRSTAKAFMGAVASTGVADRQQVFAKAWKEIRAVCNTVTSDQDIPGVRERVVDLVLEHEVPPRDHAKFISQAEAAMLDALEARVAMVQTGKV